MSNSNYRYSINFPKSRWNLCLQCTYDYPQETVQKVSECLWLCKKLLMLPHNCFYYFFIIFLRFLNFEQFDSDLPISHRKIIYEICQSNFFLLIHSTNHWLRVVGTPEPWNNCQKIEIFWNWSVYWNCWQIKTMKLNINLHVSVKSFRISQIFEFFIESYAV